MVMYGSVSEEARKIRKLYATPEHSSSATPLNKVYVPVSLPDAFDTLTIRSGGVGNITGTDPVTFTTHIIEADQGFWRNIMSGAYIPLRIESTRATSGFGRSKKLTFIYRRYGSSAESSYSLLDYGGSSDSDYKSGLTRYGFSYKSSFSNGTDVIDFTMTNAYKTKLAYKDIFTPSDWGEITYYSGYTTHKSLRRSSSKYLEDNDIIDIDYDKFEQFLESNSIDTTKTVDPPSSLFSTDWDFTDTNGETVTVSDSHLTSTTGITCSTQPWGMGTLYFFDKKVPDPTSAVVTKKLRSGAEYESLCTDGGPMGTGSYTIDGGTVAAGSAISFKFGLSNGSVGDGFLAGSKYLTSLDMNGRLGSIGKYFLMRCPVFNSALSISSVVSIGSYFLAYCDTFNSSISYLSKLKTIGNYFLAEDGAFNQSVSLGNVTTIGTYFMYRCLSFNKPLSIPSSVTSIGTFFMSYMRDMTSTVYCYPAATVAASSTYTLNALNNSAASYTTGIKLSGTYKQEWHDRFPDRTSTPYRKTIVQS